MKPIITVEGVSKRYTIGRKESYGSLRDEVMDALSSPFRRIFGGAERSPDPSVWALKDVSFDVFEGDVLGIIGRNGAGKSTLLKILSRITEPTEGRIEMRGRIASLLEVGTGFHPELTGRENIFMNGALLGMSSREIKAKFDEIVAFSEIEKFLDTPVKRYSSGMYVRLAFAVAAHLEPEILIIDEVLAVGDTAFQKKCLGKMGEVAKGGRTVLFVSHNMTAVKSLCNKCIWMEQGTVKDNGETSRVIDSYFGKATGIISHHWKNSETASDKEKVELQYAEIKVEGKDTFQNITVNDPLSLHFKFLNFETDSMLNFSLHLFNAEDIKIFNTVSNPSVYPAGVFSGTCHIPANFLNDGIYRVKIMITKDMSTPIFWLDDVLVFEVQDSERQGNWFGKWSGVVRPALKWDTELPGKPA